MWRRHLTLGLLTVISGIWFASWQAHTPFYSALKKFSADSGDDYLSVVRVNLRQHLSNHYHLSVTDTQLQVAPLPSGFLTTGQPFLAVFSAIKEEGQNSAPDIYVMQVNMGQNASPLSFTPPRNLSDNPMSRDTLFEVKLVEEATGNRRGIQVLFGQFTEEGDCRSVTYLWWGEESQQHAKVQSTNPLTRWLSALDNKHFFNRQTAPDWQIVRFATPLPQCSARLGRSSTEESDRGLDQFEVFSKSKLVVTVDTIIHSLSPRNANVELIGAVHPEEQTIGALQETLKIYDLLNQDEDQNLNVLRSKISTSLEHNLYELFVDESDPSQHRSVGEVSSILDGRRPTWYPPRIDVKSGFPSEGEWRAVKLTSEGEPLMLKTFIRLDPEYPYHSIHLYAMDMRRLALRFVGGGDFKDRGQEGVGSSRVREDDQEKVIIAFSGGPERDVAEIEGQSIGYSHGIVQNHHVLVPPTEGLPTVAIDDRGRVALGRLDVAQLPWSWSSLRQSYAPLVDLRIRDRDFVPPQSPKGRLDHLHLNRSALGINQQGTLIFAWSDATTTQLLAQAMKLVGVKFALSLRSSPQQNGLAVYPETHIKGQNSKERPLHKKMQVDPKIWREGSANDFFYLVLAQSLPKFFPQRPANWGDGEGLWTPVAYQNIDPWLATSFVTESRVGTDVELLRIDGDRLRVNLSLGGHKDKRFSDEERPLGAEPVARIPIGFTSSQLGVSMLSKVHSPPQLGKMTWVVDDQGHSTIGRWGQGEINADGSWNDLLQGEALIDQGKALSLLPPAPQPLERSSRRRGEDTVEQVAEPLRNGPMTALGITANHDLIIASVHNQDLEALQKAMIAAGVTKALRLTYRGTAHTGRPQFFYRHQGQTFYNVYPDLALKPAFLQTKKSALIGFEDALILTPRGAPPRARFIQSFTELAPGEE